MAWLIIEMVIVDALNAGTAGYINQFQRNYVCVPILHKHLPWCNKSQKVDKDFPSA
jgi:hypothetical protein